jgi:hypothetical protein
LFSKLEQLEYDLRLIADRAGVLAGEADVGEFNCSETSDVTAHRVRKLIRTRRLRERYISGDIFADPAWDMILDLYAARLEGRTVAVTSLCIASGVPLTTALRWIKSLTERRIFVRTPDPHDGRRALVDLSEDTAAAVEKFMAAIRNAETV